jgi:hypothetical protein
MSQCTEHNSNSSSGSSINGSSSSSSSSSSSNSSSGNGGAHYPVRYASQQLDTTATSAGTVHSR